MYYLHPSSVDLLPHYRSNISTSVTETLVDHFLEGARELQVDFVSELLFWIKDDTLQVCCDLLKNYQKLLKIVKN